MSKRAQEEKARRERYKEAGLVKLELWVTEENKRLLKAFEQDMRKNEITHFGLEGGDDE